MGRRRAREEKANAAGKASRAWKWRLLLFLGAVFAVKAVVLSQLQHHPLLEPDGGVDSAEYVRLAREALGGNVLLGPGLYHLSPLYVYFLAGLLGVADSFPFVRLVQIALGTAAVGCIFLSARIWFGERAAWIAAVLAALTGVFTFYEIVVFQSSIDVFLTAAALYALAAAIPPEDGSHRARSGEAPVVSAFRRNSTIAGALFGLEFLNRPNVAIAIAGVLILLVSTRRWRHATWMAAGLAMAVAPLVARNAIVTHELAVTSSQGGLNFYIGNHAGATGQYEDVPGVRANMAGQAEDTRKVAEAAAGRPLTDAQVSSYFTGLALTWILKHPSDAAVLFVRKLALTFNARHQWLDYSYPYYAYDTGSLLWVLFVGPWVLVPLGSVGVAWLLTGSPGSPGSGSLVWVAFVPLYALSVATFFVAERYRLPLFVPLCVLSGGALARLPQALRKSSFAKATLDRPASSSQPPTSARAALAIALGLAGAVVTAWPFTIDDGRYEERLRLSKVLMNERDYGDAASELEHALALRQGDTTTEFNLGMAEISAGRAEEGIAHVRRAVDAGVPIAGARYALVSAMLQTGNRQGALSLLSTYEPAGDDSAESCYQVAMLAMNAGAPRVARRYAQRALDLRPDWTAALELISRIPR
jgi:4-amino-4-deoxy-L-arabinose transferase-like glycosyltransferase